MISTTASTTSADVHGRLPSDTTTDQLFELLGDYCSNEQLRQLLRVYRPSERDYALNGNRDQLKQSVRRLYSTGHLPRTKLDAILERAEENGRQHVFLYVPQTPKAAERLSNFAAMQSALLDGQTREGAGLPRFQVRPKGVMVADMRREERPGTKYWYWVFKLYAGAEAWRVVGQPELRGDEKIVRYKLKYSREVLLVKWHSFGLLEVRIPTGNSQMQLASIRHNLVTTISKAIAHADGKADSMLTSVAAMATDFSPKRRVKATDLIAPGSTGSLESLRVPVSELDGLARSGKAKWISVNETDYDVDGHTVTVKADSQRENLYQNPILAEALENVNDCERLNAVIEVREQPEYPEKLAVEFCPTAANEVRIGAEASPEVIEFIIRRVWEYARGAETLPASPVDSIVSEAPQPSDLTTMGFDVMAEAHPYLANAIIRLGQWVKDHPTADYLDPARLQKQLGTGLHATDLAVAVATLIQDGVLVQKYRVRPGGKRRFLSQVFDSLDDVVDKEIRDESGELIDLKEAVVVPVYGKAGQA